MLAQIILSDSDDLTWLFAFVVLVLIFLELKLAELVFDLFKLFVFAVESGDSSENFIHVHVAFKVIQLISTGLVLLVSTLPYHSQVHKI
jgi:hypothetical protein